MTRSLLSTRARARMDPFDAVYMAIDTVAGRLREKISFMHDEAPVYEARWDEEPLAEFVQLAGHHFVTHLHALMAAALAEQLGTRFVGLDQWCFPPTLDAPHPRIRLRVNK